MNRVNYGTNVIELRRLTIFGGEVVSFVHEGDDGHERLRPGEQCACGVLGLGIVRGAE